MVGNIVVGKVGNIIVGNIIPKCVKCIHSATKDHEVILL